MCTVFLAWVNAKYQHNYDLLFIGTLLIDIKIINVISNFFSVC